MELKNNINNKEGFACHIIGDCIGSYMYICMCVSVYACDNQRSHRSFGYEASMQIWSPVWEKEPRPSPPILSPHVKQLRFPPILFHFLFLFLCGGVCRYHGIVSDENDLDSVVFKPVFFFLPPVVFWIEAQMEWRFACASSQSIKFPLCLCLCLFVFFFSLSRMTLI